MLSVKNDITGIYKEVKKRMVICIFRDIMDIE